MWLNEEVKQVTLEKKMAYRKCANK